MNTHPKRHSTSLLKARYRQLLCCGVFFAAVGAYGATLNSYWIPESGDWADPDNWTEQAPGDPVPPGDVNRVVFQNAEPITYEVSVSGTQTFNQIQTRPGVTVNLNFQDGASLSGVSITQGNSVGVGSGGSHLNINGPSTGTATLNLSGYIQVGAASSVSGSTTTVTGAGMRVVDTGQAATVGRLGDNAILTIREGAQWTGRAMSIAGNTKVSDGGNDNNSLVITGANSSVDLSGNPTYGYGLLLGSAGYTDNSASNYIEGNTVRVEDGGRLTVDGTASIRVGSGASSTQRWRRDNSIRVSGANSQFIVNGGATLTVGYAHNDTYNNRLEVSDGGVIRTNGIVDVLSGTGANKENILSIENGGTLTSNNTINVSNSLMRIEQGGALLAEDIDGTAAAATVNVTGIGRLEAAGHIGEGITVELGNGDAAVFAFGADGYEDAETLLLDGTLNFNAGSFVDYQISEAGIIDQIAIGATGSVLIDSAATLRIFSDTEFLLGDSFQLFSGNVAGISGLFDQNLMLIPSLGEGLKWDLSQFTAEYGFALSVTAVPEPSTIALIMGAGVLGLAYVVRRRQRG